MSVKDQILLLAICALLLLTPGDTLQCQQCQSMPPDLTCKKYDGFETCKADPDTKNCNVARIYIDGNLYSIVRGCWRNEDCNAEGSIGNTKVILKCCSDSDLCNKDM